MADTLRYLLGPHGVLEGTPEEVQASGFDPWQSQIFTGLSNPEQFGRHTFTWSGYGLPAGETTGLDSASPSYIPELLDLRAKVQGGQASDAERTRYDAMVQSAQAIPLRQASGLTFGADEEGTWKTLGLGSPDLGGLMLQIAEKQDQGTATDQERDLFRTTESALRDQTYRANVPQASDAFSIWGDNLLGAMAVLGMGVSGGLAGGALAAGGGGLASTLGSLGTLSGIAGTGASTLGSALQQPWLQQAGMGLGIAGGLAGGLGGLSTVLEGGVNSLSDAARLAQSAGKITGALGNIPGVEALKDVSKYLGAAGQLGGGIDTLADVFGGDVHDLTAAARIASGLGQVTGGVGRLTGNRPLQQASSLLGLGSRLGSNVQGLLGAAHQAQQPWTRTQGPVPVTMTPDEWLRLYPPQEPVPLLGTL